MVKKNREINLKNIRAVCFKEGMDDCLFRKLSYYLAIPVLHTKLTPTDITWFWVILGLASAPFFFMGSYWFTLVGTFLLCFGFLLDHLDGGIARFKKQYSDKGYFLDEIGSYVLIPAFLIALGFGGYHKTGQFIWVWLGIISICSYYIYQIMLLLQIKQTKKGITKKNASNEHPGVYGKYQFLTKILPAHFDQICYILVVLAIFGVAEWLLAYFAFVYTGMWLGKSAYDYLFGFKN